jgi:hypothetical protein
MYHIKRMQEMPLFNRDFANCHIESAVIQTLVFIGFFEQKLAA